MTTTYYYHMTGLFNPVMDQVYIEQMTYPVSNAGYETDSESEDYMNVEHEEEEFIFRSRCVVTNVP